MVIQLDDEAYMTFKYGMFVTCVNYIIYINNYNIYQFYKVLDIENSLCLDYQFIKEIIRNK